MAFTCAVRSISARNPEGTSPPGKPSAASVASCAAVSRSFSQSTRKVEIEGRKISTSASMTNTAVSMRSFEGRPMSRQLRWYLAAHSGTRTRRHQSANVSCRGSFLWSRSTRFLSLQGPSPKPSKETYNLA